MIHTPVCELLGIEHPIVLGGMAGSTAAALVAAVSQAGGLGTLGGTYVDVPEMTEQITRIRQSTDRPFGINFLLFDIREETFAAALAQRVAHIAFAWPWPEQDLASYIARAHDAGAKVMFMAGSVAEAKRAVAAGADAIVAQGTEGGGHVGWMASMPLVPMVVDAVAPVPVLAAGGIADGRGLAAVLALGAQGALLGTRLLATDEAPLHPRSKQAIIDSDGHDTVLTEIPDIASGRVWPGAMARSRRNAFIARWAGREWDLRQERTRVWQRVIAARQAGDVDNAPLLYGQDAGLIDAIAPAGEIVRNIVAQAADIIANQLPRRLCAISPR